MTREVPVFKCLFCDRCCYFEKKVEAPIVFPWEKRLLEEVAENLGVELFFEPTLVFKDEKSVCVIGLYRWVIKGYCPFFDKQTRLCIIHDSKPLACKMYPLLVEMPTNRLMVSAKCEWIKRHGVELLKRLENKPELIPVVFSNEFEAVRDVLLEFRAIEDVVKEKNLKRIGDLKECKRAYDLDDYITRFG